MRTGRIALRLFALSALTVFAGRESFAHPAALGPSRLAECLAQLEKRMPSKGVPGLSARIRYAKLDPARGELAYRTFGDPANPPLVLIHGLDSSYMTFANVTDELARKYFVIAFDQRGHGLSETGGNAFFPDLMADDVAALLDHLGIESADVLGHSMGARTAMAFYERYPQRLRRMIVEDMELHARKEISERVLSEMLDLSEKLRGEFEGKVFRNREELRRALEPYFGDEAGSLTIRRAKEHADGTMTLLFRPWVTPLYGYFGNTQDFLGSFGSLGERALVLIAEARSSAISGQGLARMRQANPKATYVSFPGHGHTLHRPDPEAFLKAATQFLDQPAPTVSAAAKGTGMNAELMKKIAASSLAYDPELAKLNMLPTGSALATGAGNLERTGIRQIIHAASGAMAKSGAKFDPTLASVKGSVKASLEIARRNGHRRVAVPFIGGKIFAERIGIPLDDLARAIVETALAERHGLEIRFMTFGPEDTERFRRAVAKAAPNEGEAIAVVDGDITNFAKHGASAIVNAANTEVLFGGGLSGIIARATGRADEIDEEAAAVIREFHRQFAGAKR